MQRTGTQLLIAQWPAIERRGRIVDRPSPPLRIYHTSDLHDRRGFASRLRALRAEAPGLLFDSGDSLRGSQTVYYRNEPIVAEIDAAGYDAQAIGNREFHYIFRLLGARARRMRHPLLCANLSDTRRRPLPFDAERDFVCQGRRVRVFALLVPQYRERSFWERVLRVALLRSGRDGARYRGAHAARHAARSVVASGIAGRPPLARAVPQLGLILGGHSHDTLGAPEVVDGVPIVHAGPYGRYVSRTEFEYGPDGAAAPGALCFGASAPRPTGGRRVIAAA